MTIQECYRQLGGDFGQVERRLSSEKLLRRFLAKFPEDGSFPALCSAMEEGCRDQAFRAAHTLKGVSGNLGLERLFSSVSRLEAVLRPEAEGIPPDARFLFREVKLEQQLAVSTIRTYLDDSR